MSLEEAGVPTVAIHTHVFARLAEAVALAGGMPTTRQAYVPQPLVGVTADGLRDYIHGTDPIHDRPFMQELIEGLSAPLNDNDLNGVSFERPTEKFLEPDTEDNLRQLFEDNHWTDFMPIVLPTEERVAAMLKGTSHAPDEVVGRLRPTAFREFWEFTVEKVAVNAVMAGCRPEYLPVVLAHAASGVTARSSSTTSFASFSVVNGPVRGEIGMSDGIGAMGPHNHANVSIGRAYNLLSVNLQGGSEPGDTHMGSLGNPMNYALTFAEAEERSPWRPLHVQRGFKPEDSTVSVFHGGRYNIAGFGPRQTWAEQFKRAFAACQHNLVPTLIVDPITARQFVDLGFDSKEKLAAWLAENGTLPAREYWDDLWVQTLQLPMARAGVEPFASKLKAGPEEEVTLFEPEDINIVVTGGETQGAWKLIAGKLTKEATISVDEWR
ncbi:MAG: UGSC family (seleno)protein [Rhodospirillales bacterium]|nr:UGSC family (seleno)protein [Rhodospirillales bacterium]